MYLTGQSCNERLTSCLYLSQVIVRQAGRIPILKKWGVYLPAGHLCGLNTAKPYTELQGQIACFSTGPVTVNSFQNNTND